MNVSGSLGDSIEFSDREATMLVRLLKVYTSRFVSTIASSMIYAEGRKAPRSGVEERVLVRCEKHEESQTAATRKTAMVSKASRLFEDG